MELNLRQIISCQNKRSTNMEKKIVSILIPAYNEEKRIGKTLEPLLKSQFIHEIIVIDDGSQDQTAKKPWKKGLLLAA